MPSPTPDQLTDLALREHHAGSFARAEQLYRQALARDPNFVPALAHLAILLQQLGNLAESEKLWREVVRLDGRNPQAHERLGTTLGMLGRMPEAIASLRTAIALDPNFAQAWSNLANALREVGSSAEASSACRRALELNPNDASAHCNLAAGYQESGRLDEAITHYRRAIALAPEAAIAHYNLAMALWTKGDKEASLESAQRAADLAPHMDAAQNLLGWLLSRLNELERAETVIRSLLRRNPDRGEAHSDLATLLQRQGRSDEALPELRRAVELMPDAASVHSDLLLSLHYVPPLEPAVIFQEHVEWARRHAKVASIQQHRNDRSPQRRLRIGYMSPDFRRHAVVSFIEPVLEHRDRGRFEIFCYSTSPEVDDVTARMRGRADHWRDASSLSDERVAEMIRTDGIDMLIDLAGHTARGRPLVLARKPAPIQVTYLGYPNTTGLRTVDYRVTDAIADPPGATDAQHTEQLFRLPHTAWCYRPEMSPEVRNRDDAQPVTFGSFNNLAKLTPQWIAVWSDVLRKVKGSRMILKTSSFHDVATQQRVREQFTACGVDNAADRIILLGARKDPAEHLAAYHDVDIALDTFPYHGTTTTCEALWMGVPVVTMAGNVHVSRVGASLLTTVGLPDLVADSVEVYVNAAIRLAGDVSRRRELRSSMRDRLRASPLMDEIGFTRAFEQALRSMWLKFIAVMLIVLSVTPSRASAQTTQPAWTKSKEGDLILRSFDHAPYPHTSREQGFKGSKQFFPKAGHYDDSTVAVFVPHGYVPGDRVDFIVHFHGHMTQLPRVLEKHRLAEQVYASKVNAILVVPQGPKEAADSGCGKLELDPGAFAKLLDEICAFLKQEGKITSTTIGHVVLSAHSGGYKVTAAVLDHGGLTDHITDVLLLDSSYGSLEWFAAWCGQASNRRLVSLYTEHLADENKTLMGLLDNSKVNYDRLDETAISSDVIKQRKPLFIPTAMAHNDVPMKQDYLKRLLETSALASDH